MERNDTEWNDVACNCNGDGDWQCAGNVKCVGKVFVMCVYIVAVCSCVCVLSALPFSFLTPATWFST